MARGNRSTSKGRTRAILHAKIMKPVEDARTARLSARLCADSVPCSPLLPTVSLEAGRDVDMTDVHAADKKHGKKLSIAAQITQKPPRGKKAVRAAKAAWTGTFNSHGLSVKEMRF